MLRQLATVLAVAPLVMSAVQAQPVRQRPTMQERAVLKEACTADFVKFCTGVDPNSPEVEACYERNMTSVSSPCRQAVESYLRRAKAG